MTQPVCHECGDMVPEGQPMAQVRHGFCDGETVADIDGSRDEDDIDYAINYHAQCYADGVLSHLPERDHGRTGLMSDVITAIRNAI